MWCTVCVTVCARVCAHMCCYIVCHCVYAFMLFTHVHVSGGGASITYVDVRGVLVCECASRIQAHTYPRGHAHTHKLHVTSTTTTPTTPTTTSQQQRSHQRSWCLSRWSSGIL